MRFGYSFGFNGMERDDEVKGQGNSYDFGARIYDSRLGRWLATDPLQYNYVSLSTYSFAGNSPIIANDPDGKKIEIVGTKEFRKSVRKTMFSLMIKSKTGRQMVLAAIHSDKLLVVTTTEGNTGVQGGSDQSTLFWNSETAGDDLDAANGLGTEGLVMPEEVRLAHEIDHFLASVERNGQADRRIVVDITDPAALQYDNNGNVITNAIKATEVRAVDAENKVRAEMGKPLRTHYGGFNVFQKEISNSPTDKFAKENKTGAGFSGYAYSLVNKKNLPGYDKFKIENTVLVTTKAKTFAGGLVNRIDANHLDYWKSQMEISPNNIYKRKAGSSCEGGTSENPCGNDVYEASDDLYEPLPE